MKISIRKRILWAAALWLVVPGCGMWDTVKARKQAREGNSLYRAFDYRGAIEKYRAAISLDADTPNVYLNLGYSHFSIFDPSSESELEKQAADHAVGAFEEHLKRNPLDEAAQNFLIKVLLKAAPYNQDLADRAHATFLEMLKKNPKDHEARQYLVTLFIDGKRYEDAVTFFGPDLEKKPDDIEMMKILAIIADKSDKPQQAIDWYFKRAQVVEDQEEKALLFYEVGTYAWNLIHYQPDRVKGTDAIRLIDQGIEAERRAMGLKEQYAEAMVYGNLLYLKRAIFETEEVARTWDMQLAYDLRVAAGKIIGERKKKKSEEQDEAPDEKDKQNQSTEDAGASDKKEG